LDEIEDNISDKVREACGTNARCIFDATQTGNLDIGMATMQTDEGNQEDQMISG
jgi:hypothetical protein